MARRWGRTRSKGRASGWAGAGLPFEIPPDVVAAWRRAGERGQAPRKAWLERLAAAAPDRRAELERRIRGDLPAGRIADAVRDAKAKLAAAPKDIASRIASENAIETLTAAAPEMIGGSADLTGSNNTRPKGMKALSAADYGGRFVHYGVREHGMAAAMNGMALHGGIIPFAGTFLVFSDYCRPAIRLAALMGQRVIHVMTHDSIGLGEDGPTHQPVEHLAALRAIPNLLVFRPCDAVETLECWQLALAARDRPSVLALTRQNLPQLRREADDRNRCAAGAYEIAADGRRRRCVAVRHRIGSLDRGRSPEAPARTRHSGARRIGAVLRAVLRARPRPSGGSHRRGAGAGRGRGRHPPGLGRDHRLGRRFRRHDDVRGERPRQGALQPFRHHRREGGGLGAAKQKVRLANGECETSRPIRYSPSRHEPIAAAGTSHERGKMLCP